MSAWTRIFGPVVRRKPASRSAPRASVNLEALEDRTVPTLLGQQLFPGDNPWNQKISMAPVAANSAAIINNIVTKAGDGRLHPDFGQDYNTANADLYGIPYNIVHGNSTAKVNVVIDDYADESDLLPVPIPANVVLEGDYQTGPKAGVDNRGDSHLIIFDVDNNIAYEFYRASRPSENADGKWHADQQSVWDMTNNTYRTRGWTSADAAGLPILAGLVRPDEGLPVSQGGQGAINHAIRFTLQNSIVLDQYIYPASHTANPGNTNVAIQPPMGSRFRLKASVDLSQFNPQARIVAQAMKDYGMILADNGSNFYFSGASASVNASNQQTLTWDDDDIQDSIRGLKGLRFSDFEVVDLTPKVTDLSLHNGTAGTTITVSGQNFSGASGHIQVFFGNVPATLVSVVNDTQVIAIAPPGSGTVDVRVQSGVTTAADADNIKSTIFGYGVSAVSAADRFTYGAPPVDSTPPTSAVNRLPAFETNPSFAVTWSGNDGVGSGIARYDVYVAIDGGSFSAWKTATTTTQATYAGAIGHRYDFYSVALDNAGNRQTLPTAAQASIAVKSFTIQPPPNLLAVALKMSQSDESYGIFITRAYTAYLKRSPDSAGFNMWLSRMRTGQTTDEQLEAELVGSAEYIAAHGGFGPGWVTGIYNDLLSRFPSSSELAGWVAKLKPGVSPVAIAYGFAHGTEREANRVRQNFQTYLGRAPATSEVASWVDQFMNRGMTTEVMAANFVASPEFFNNPAKGASTNAVWIVAAHQALLGRAASSAEMTTVAVSLLPPTNLGTIASQLTHADESYRNFIIAAYTRYLGRSPDTAGLNSWLSAMRTGQVSDERLEAAFVGSAEYIVAHGGAGAGWVRGMYTDLLNRTPSTSEVNSWVAALNAGASPVTVAYGFAASAEREGIRVRQNYQTYLGRSPTANEVNVWVDLFVNRGMTSETMTAGFVGSAEYFQNAIKGNGSIVRWLDAAFLDVYKRAITESELVALIAVLR